MTDELRRSCCDTSMREPHVNGCFGGAFEATMVAIGDQMRRMFPVGRLRRYTAIRYWGSAWSKQGGHGWASEIEAGYAALDERDRKAREAARALGEQPVDSNR